MCRFAARATLELTCDQEDDMAKKAKKAKKTKKAAATKKVAKKTSKKK
ncbi:hypothetical protein [Bradyrhizobium liaoningense]|nr:hypothetical protein [Bradyrhizobium liaoningense]MBR0856913.1 hypothetical protein [Bradyrhizobium liaoningense]